MVIDVPGSGRLISLRSFFFPFLQRKNSPMPIEPGGDDVCLRVHLLYVSVVTVNYFGPGLPHTGLIYVSAECQLSFMETFVVDQAHGCIYKYLNIAKRCLKAPDSYREANEKRRLAAFQSQIAEQLAHTARLTIPIL